ncbi:uncharacterized protein CLAFUR5_05818 [Fulvia fulva]|uniref:Uncharacterized protein n=1 Tax=Passalora fulva TaxID=5499 RepID=A0A9Q8P9E7_PASFU|nr:uncharacterized protein CLAFUR5_05818 [Fulvia fulva]KAK4625166.1 hypothetical protein CLAFUR0_05679 [Fulvia fulva]UJO18179.1 hypothetical protein CLAFUR5_05818 [Fulvia fulva]
MFDEGAMMTIRWTTDFPSVNLCIIANQSYNSPRMLASGYVPQTLDWEAECYINCSIPFMLRAVDAEGTPEKLAGGGFTSRQFWIKPPVVSSSTSASTPNSAASSTS